MYNLRAHLIHVLCFLEKLLSLTFFLSVLTDGSWPPKESFEVSMEVIKPFYRKILCQKSLIQFVQSWTLSSDFFSFVPSFVIAFLSPYFREFSLAKGTRFLWLLEEYVKVKIMPWFILESHIGHQDQDLIGLDVLDRVWLAQIML